MTAQTQKMKPSARKASAAIAQWQPSIPLTWSFQQILNAVRQQAMGDFTRSAQLFRSMQEDDEIPESLEKLTDSVLRAPFSVECEDEAIQKLTAKLACKMFPDGELTSFIEGKIVQGAAIGVLDWITEDDVWYPVIRFLDPEFQSYDPARKTWRYNTTNGLIDVTPGDGTWVVWCDSEYGYLRGKIRALARLWYFKNLTYRSWNRYNERHGLPIVKAFIPLASEAGEKEQFVDDVQDMGAEGVVPLPLDQDEWNSYDLELLEATDQSWETFESLIERADRKIQKIFTGHNLTSEVASTGANRAASQSATDEKDGIKAKSLAQKLSEFLYQQVLPAFIWFNFGPDKEIPRCCWNTDPPEDKNQNATAISSLATGLKTLGEAGYTVTNIEEVAAEFGLKVTYEKPEALKPQPVQRASPGSSGGKFQLLSGDEADGAVEGVRYADEIADHVGREATQLIRPSVKTLILMVRSAESYPDLEQRIKLAFSQCEPSDLADILEQAMLLAQLDGRHAVMKDALTEENRK